MTSQQPNDPVRIMSQPGLKSVNDWLRAGRPDMPHVVGRLRGESSLRALVDEFVIPGVDDVFLGALTRLPKWLDAAVRHAIAEALDSGLDLRIEEFLEPLPDSLWHAGVEMFSDGDGHVILVRIPERIACGAT